MTHLEYYITKSEVLFGEIAMRPPGGYIMEALTSCYNQNFWDLLIKVELLENDIHINTLKNYASSIIIHPGAGEVLEIMGKEVIESLDSKTKFKLKFKVGDTINKREGVGQDYGYLILRSQDPSKLGEDIDRFFSEFKVIVKTL